MKFNIVENSPSIIRVSVRVPKRTLSKEKAIHVDTGDVMAFLEREGIAFDTSVEGCVEQTVVDNYSNNPNLEGEWAFRKITTRSKPAAQKKRRTSVPKPTTENKPSAPKRRRKASKPRVEETKPEEDKLLGIENLE